MNYLNRHLAVTTGILIALAGNAVPAIAQMPITTCGFPISAPGNYIVKADLSGCAGDGIDIYASNVTVNLNGHIINAGSPSLCVGVNVGIPASPIRLNHVGIQGPGLIKNFVAGVNITRCDYCQVALVTSAQNANGMSVDHINYINVASNVLVANTGAGLLLSESVNGVVAYNEVSGNGSSCPGSTPLPGGVTSLVVCGQGLFIEDSSANTVNNNTLSGNLANGIWQDMASQFSRIYSNVTDGNAGVGILIDRSGGNGIFITVRLTMDSPLTSSFFTES
jgi:parallel beta-helix repeat protein